MNEIANRFLLVGDKFMREMYLNSLVLLTVIVGHLPKTKKEMKSLCRTGNTDFIYKNELDKACFQHDMAYGKSKDLAKRTQSDKVLRDKAFKIASDPEYDGYQSGLASMIYKFFDKKSRGSGIANKPNYELAISFINQLLKI